MYALSDATYCILYYVVRYRRKIVRSNLLESFPQKSEAEIVHLEQRFYRFFTDLMLESCKMAFITPEEIRNRMRFHNAEAVNAAVHKGHSIALYLGHYGNWEWIASMPLWLEKEITGAQIYHKLSNPHIDRLMLFMRERMGSVCVDMHRTARFINEKIRDRKPCVIGFIADQSPKKRDVRYSLSFLNHNTPVLTGTEKIIKHYGFEAWYVDVRRVGRGYYEAEFVRISEDTAQVPDYELTDAYFRLLEQTIRRQPELYLWSHNRFRLLRKRKAADNK